MTSFILGSVVRRYAARLFIATVGFALLLFLAHLPHGPDHWSADLRAALLSDRLPTQHPGIAIIEVTDRTLLSFSYVQPVDRRLLADIVRRVDEAGARIIGLDFIFDRHSEPEKDGDLIAALRSAHAPVVLGRLDDEDLSEESSTYQSAFISKTGRQFGHLYFGDHWSPGEIGDQVVREVMERSTRGAKSFAEVVAAAAGSQSSNRSPVISWLRPPADGSETFLTLSADDILGSNLTGTLPLNDLLKDRLVLVGVNLPYDDQHLTPFSVLHGARYPGVWIHAQVLAQYLDGGERLVRPAGWVVWIALVALAAGSGFATGRSSRLATLHPWIEISTIVFFIVASIFTFTVARLVFPFVAVTIAWGWGEMVAHFVPGPRGHGAR